MARHLTRRPEEAADLVQETYLRALAAEDRFELRESGVRPWLFKILHNVFFTRRSRDKRGPAFLEEVGEAVDLDVDQAPCWDLATLDWEQVDDRLKRSIDELPPHYRTTLLLWAVEGLKYREIADVMGVAIGTVMSRLSRARSLLARPLNDLAREHGIHQAQGVAIPGAQGQSLDKVSEKASDRASEAKDSSIAASNAALPGDVASKEAGGAQTHPNPVPPRQNPVGGARKSGLSSEKSDLLPGTNSDGAVLT